jgi:MFS family permease
VSALIADGAHHLQGAPVFRSYPAPRIIAVLFCGYLSVGLPLPVIPLFVHDRLGFSSFVVGLVIGIQFLATVLTRGYAGRMTDRHGGKRSAIQGAAVCAFGGVLYLAAVGPGLSPAVSLTIVVLARLTAGFGESQLVTGCVSWSIASVAPQRAGVSMSWTGIAMFGALAVGAPIGMTLYQRYGLQASIVACIVAPLVATAIAFRERCYVTSTGQRLPFYRVIGQIWREGFGLMLQSVGIAVLSTFASLYFLKQGWDHGGLVMTAFGAGFIGVRLLLGHLPDKIGGYRVALCSLVAEAIGQAMVWVAPNEGVALAGALVTGFGCALVYPALGVEALRRVPPANRGSAMGAFSAFLDIAFGLTGPVAGLVAGQFGYAAVYLLGSACAFVGAALYVDARNLNTSRSTRSRRDPAA